MEADQSAAIISWYDIEQATKHLLTGTTTAAVTQVWGCGHEVHSANGDSLYASCPFCYARAQRS